MILSAPFVIASTPFILLVLGLSGLTSLLRSSLSSSLLSLSSSLSGEVAPAPPRLSSGQYSDDPGYYDQPHGQYGQYYRSDEARQASFGGWWSITSQKLRPKI